MDRIIYRYITGIFLLLSAGFTGYSQEGITVPLNQYAPTPKALEMTRYGHMPPDLNSGIYSYDIPIYTYEDRYFHIPVSLHYSSSGFQPARMSDEAGLHWTLMAGGAITREIVGVDDMDSTYGMNGSNYSYTDSTIYNIIKPNPSNHLFSYNSPINTPQLDGQSECSSDRYHFSFPGHSGSFVMDHGTGSPKEFTVYGTENGHGLYSVTYEGAKLGYFVITTGDGYSYRFGHDATGPSMNVMEINWSRDGVVGQEQASELSSDSYHVVSWLLDQITAPDGSTVSFEYVSNWFQNDIPDASRQEDVLTSFSRHPYSRYGFQLYKSASLTKTAYLSRIVVDTPLSSGETLSVNFNWVRDSNREIAGTEDGKYTQLVVPRRHLSSIEVKMGNTVLRRADLTYAMSGLRPLLTEVSLSNIGSYTMTYWTNPSMPLPGILNNGLDFWGYYNGLNSNTDAFTSPMTVDADLNESITDNRMNPSWECARLGLLKKIEYPTGGYTAIEYEPNTANKILLRRKDEQASGILPANPNISDPDSTAFLPSLFSVSTMSSGFAQDCGGVRVKTLTDNDGTSSSTYTFSYTGGIIQQFPRFYAGRIGSTPVYNPALRFPGSSFDQRHVAYNTVRQTYPDSSYVETTFSNWEGTPDQYSPHHETVPGVIPDSAPLQQLFYDHILREPDSRAYQRGLQTSQKVYNNAGNLVSQDSWEYEDIQNGTGYRAYALYSGQYTWTARTFLCDRKPSRHVHVQKMDGPGESISETTDYAYNAAAQLSSTTLNSGGHTEIETTTYPRDLVRGIYPAMTAAHYLNYPVERVHIRDGKVINAELTRYKPVDNMYLPLANYKADVGDGIQNFSPYNGQTVGTYYQKRIYFISYGSHGQLKKSEDHEGTPTTYVWDVRGDKLAALYVGAAQGQLGHYIRSVTDYTEKHIYANSTNAVATFTCDEAGSFSFYFAPGGLTTWINANLDGNAITVSILGDGTLGTSSPLSISAGTHTLDITGSSLNNGVTGQLSLTFPRTVAEYESGTGTDYLFNDFESGGGSANYGFESSRGRTSQYSKTLTLLANRSYVLDYMRREDNKWHYVRETVVPTTNSYTISIPATASSPIDHVRFYPAESAVASFTWYPTGEMRCQVDADGNVKTYAYDSLGRLTNVYDRDGNLLEEYTYHYQTEL